MASLKSRKRKKGKTNKTSAKKKSRTPSLKTRSSEIGKITQNLQLLENSYYGACILDAHSLRLIYANHKLCHLLGYSKREMEKRHIKSVIHPDDHARVRKAIKNRIQGLPIQTEIRYRLVRKNGSELIGELVTNPVAHHEKSYLHTTIRDVSSEVTIETELKESESRFKSFFDLSPEPVITLDLSGRVTSINIALEKLTGYKSKSLIGKKFNLLPFWTNKGKTLNEKDCFQIGKRPMECKLISNDRKEKYLELYASKIPLGNGRDEILIIARDITDRKKTLSKLRESEQKYKALAGNIADGIGIVHKGRYVYVNQKFARIFGYNLSELVGKAVAKIAVSKEKGLLRSLEEEIWKGKANRRCLELTGRKKNGLTIYLDLCASRIRYRNNDALQITVMDITRRKIAEESLKQNEERFRNLVENVHYGFYITDTNTHEILFLNRYARSLTRELTKSTRGTNFFDLLSEQDIIKIGQMLRKRKEGDTKRMKGKLKVQLPNGRQMIVEYESSVIIYKGRKCVQGIFRDITEFEHARLELKESEERFRTIFETAQDCIFIKDSDLRYVHVNPTMESLFNVTAKDLIGKTDKELFGKKVTLDIHKSDSIVLTGKAINEEQTRPIHGELKTFHIIKVPMHNSAGEIIGLCGIARDITDRKKSAEELRQKQIFLDSVVENIPNMIFIKDAKDLRFKYLNKAGEELLGYDREQFIGKADRDLFYAEQADFFTKKDREVLKSGKLLDIEEEPIYTPNGKKILHTKKIPLMDENGKPQYLLGISEDITDRYKAEKTLQESEEKYRSLVEKFYDGIAIVQVNKIIFVNQKLLEIYGYKHKNEMEGHLYTDFVIPEFRNTMQDWGDKREKGVYAPDQYEYKGLRKDNSLFDADISVVAFSYQGKPAHQAIIRDITDHKKAEKILMDSEEKYRALVESSADGIAVVQGETIKFVNKKLLEIFGYDSKEEVEGQSFREFVAPEYRELMLERNRKRARGESTPPKYEFIGLRKDGTRIDANISVDIINYQGEPAHQTIIRDITERKWAERALQESEEKFRMISEQSMLGIYILQDNRIKFVNKAAAEITEVSVEEWLKRTVEDAIKQVHPDDRDYVLEQARRKMQGRKDVDFHYSYRIITKSGKTRWLEQFSRPITYGGKIADLVALIEITERKKIEEELLYERDFSTGIISGTPAIIVGISPDGITTFVNPSGEQVTGYRANELIGKNWWKTFYPGKEALQVKKLFKKFENGDVNNYEMVLTTKSKEKRIIAWNSINHLDEKGNIVEIIGFGNDITERKKAEATLKNQRDMLRIVTEDVIRVQEEERRRISMELHDSIGGSLSVIKLQISNMIKPIEKMDRDSSLGLKVISDLVSDTIADLRLISANLRPVILDNLGLWPTIEWYLKDFGKKTELDITIDIQGKDIKLGQNIENHLFRIIQQIMINIKSHSEAKKVVFKSWHKNSDIIFEISENGKGFNPEKIFDPEGRRQGMGVINIMERVNIVKGKLDIDSTPGKGTRYTISIPTTN